MRSPRSMALRSAAVDRPGPVSASIRTDVSRRSTPTRASRRSTPCGAPGASDLSQLALDVAERASGYGRHEPVECVEHALSLPITQPPARSLKSRMASRTTALFGARGARRRRSAGRWSRVERERDFDRCHIGGVLPYFLVSDHSEQPGPVSLRWHSTCPPPVASTLIGVATSASSRPRSSMARPSLYSALILLLVCLGLSGCRSFGGRTGPPPPPPPATAGEPLTPEPPPPPAAEASEEYLPVEKVPDPIVVAAWAEPKHLPREEARSRSSSASRSAAGGAIRGCRFASRPRRARSTRRGGCW